MGRLLPWLHVAAAVTLALSACRSPSEPDDSSLLIEPAAVESISVQVAGSLPVQVFARVEGYLQDGCSELRPIQQKREGNRVTLTVERQRPAAAQCTMVIKPFAENVRLEGTFTPGTYELRVNQLSASFVIG